MKILHINTFDTGGAGRAAVRLHSGLRKIGVESHVAVKSRESADEHILELPRKPRQTSLLARLEQGIAWRREAFLIGEVNPRTLLTSCRAPYRPKDFSELPVPDLYHLHWISMLVDWPVILPWLAASRPLVWTLHDMNPMRGIWHYDPHETDLSPSLRRWDEETHRQKARVLAQIPTQRLVVVSPSRWLAGEAQASELLGRFRIEVIPNAVDPEVLFPIEKTMARQALGISPKQRVIGFLAESLDDPRKGMHLLQEAMDRLRDPDVFVLMAGKTRTLSLPGPSCLSLGSLQSERLLALFYSALDAFVLPSQQDNLPNTCLEAFSCGTPVIGFDIGGIPDMVRPGKTGWLVPRGDTRALAETIDAVTSAESSTLAQLSERCRNVVLQEYSVQVQAREFLDLYEEHLEH